jgi:hypothetical protein
MTGLTRRRGRNDTRSIHLQPRVTGIMRTACCCRTIRTIS